MFRRVLFRSEDIGERGMSREQLKCLRELEAENTRLRRAVSDLTLDSEADRHMIQ